ncbi:MAG: T9SS type A sorting domain-containing protein [Bacteroidota bacterium]
MRKPFRFVFIILFYLLSVQVTQAQLQFFPIGKPSQEQITRKKVTSDTVFNTLPFFEDFSVLTNFPNPAKWQIDETTPFASSGFSINPPSINMVTLDGAKSDGSRYEEGNPFASGEADQLTSVFFDLSTFQPADSLYISFYWQAEGLGEKPTDSDFLRLQFRNREGNWVTLWQTNGDTSSIIFPFAREQIALEDTAAFHPFFAFRFQNFGRLSGGFDTWNIDYIFFFERGQRIGNDLAMSNQATSLLKNYFAMPIQQFKPEEIADTVFSSIQNISDSLHIFAPKLQVTDLYTNEIKGNFPVQALGEFPFQPGDTTFVITPRENMQLIGLQNNPDYGVTDADSLALQYSFYFDRIPAERFYIDEQSINTDLPTFLNDTLRTVVRLEDYYAYDDGIAEYAVGIYQNFGQVAYRFVLNEPDFLTSVDMYFPQIADDLRGKSFNLLVWEALDRENPNNDQIVSRLSVPFVYGDTINDFRRLTLASPVFLTDTFYVGFEQLTEEPLLVGWDKNNDSGENIFFNVNSVWEPNTEFSGSMMIRPVFDSENPVNTVDEDLQKLKKLKVFPNPANDIIYLEGESDYYFLTDITGRVVQEGDLGRTSLHSINLPTHLSGMYLLILQNKNARISRKIIVE